MQPDRRNLSLIESFNKAVRLYITRFRAVTPPKKR